MAAHTEGIRLLSMYDDEEEEDDDEEEDHQRDPKPTDADDGDDDGEPVVPEPALENPSPMVRLRSPLLADEVADRKTLASPLPPTPPLPQSQHSSPFPFTSPSPPPPPPVAGPYASAAEPLDPPRTRRGALAIVDYAHDEAAMSPEQEVIFELLFAAVYSELLIRSLC